MAHVAINDVQPWLETTKLTLASIDADREGQISTQVLSQIANAYQDQVLTWIDTSTTPALVKSIISMLYAGWYYDTVYSENPDNNSYADRLRTAAQTLITGIVAGNIVITDVPSLPDVTAPEFFPTDASSLNCPSDTNPSDGGPAFLMGKVF